jgi:hypothetical protein
MVAVQEQGWRESLQDGSCPGTGLERNPTGWQLSRNRVGENPYGMVAVQEQGWSETLQDGSCPGTELESPELEVTAPESDNVLSTCCGVKMSLQYLSLHIQKMHKLYCSCSLKTKLNRNY